VDDLIFVSQLAVTAIVAVAATVGIVLPRANRRRRSDHTIKESLRRTIDAERAKVAELETAHAAATRALAESRNAAEASSRAKDEFLAMLGHELRNPLAPIQTALELMRLRPDRANERERAVIERQTRHMMRLVDDMLDIARITRGKLELRRERVDVAELVARSIESAAPAVEHRRHELVTERQHGLVVDGDAARLVQVLANLITNAAKYTEPGGRIRVTATREGEEAVVTVRDTGRGIDPALLPHIFEMFTQEHQDLGRGEGGLGLGLAIVRSIVHLHGGTVSAASAGAGWGSELTVRLPLAPVISVAYDAPSPSDESTNGPVVLLVDDNEDAGDLLADLLRNRGCVVHVARDGAEALLKAAHVEED
jgi:signal transduction histidine kinase